MCEGVNLIMTQCTHPVFVNGIFNSEKLRSLLAPDAKILVVMDDHVSGLYGAAVKKAFDTFVVDWHVFILPSGEGDKSRESKQKIEDLMFEKQFDKRSCSLALGGGVVTDLVGFVGATYMRGMDVIYMPTSLMGMVDASIGGKTAINTKHGKNTLGVIRQPKAIIIDLKFLITLSDHAYFWAFSEVLKHHVIADAQGLQYLLDHKDQLLAKQFNAIKKMVKKSINIKLSVIENDIEDQGQRALLNIGHTLGHALERVSDFSISHGQAVAWGLLYESRYAYSCGCLSERDLHVIQHVIETLGLVIQHDYSQLAILKAMRWDKKCSVGSVRMPLIRCIGQMLDREFIWHTVDMDLMAKVLSS